MRGYVNEHHPFVVICQNQPVDFAVRIDDEALTQPLVSGRKSGSIQCILVLLDCFQRNEGRRSAIGSSPGGCCDRERGKQRSVFGALHGLSPCCEGIFVRGTSQPACQDLSNCNYLDCLIAPKVICRFSGRLVSGFRTRSHPTARGAAPRRSTVGFGCRGAVLRLSEWMPPSRGDDECSRPSCEYRPAESPY
jgi:hypothetical protein